MESGELKLGEGPRAPAQTLSNAWALMAQPALLVVAPLDNLVHPEHALARRGDRTLVRDELLLQRLEGFPEDAGHLALQASWGPQSSRAAHPRLVREPPMKRERMYLQAKYLHIHLTRGTIALLLGLLSACSHGCSLGRRLYSPLALPEKAEHLTFQTRDGWTLSVIHYKPRRS